MELPGLPVGLLGQASAINPVGQIVGTFFSRGLFGAAAGLLAQEQRSAHLSSQSSAINFPFGLAISINAAGNILGDGCDADFVECHVAFWANSTSTPVALASPGGEFIYTDIGLSSGFARRSWA